MNVVKAHIAIIDDETYILNACAETLESANYEVAKYEDGQSAIKATLETLRDDKAPDISVILCDILMPRINGPETINKILNIYKSSSYAHLAPEIMFMSAYCPQGLESKALEITGHPIIHKANLNKKNLIEAINSAAGEFKKITAA
jgi:CheY-like chemotaxis protein